MGFEVHFEDDTTTQVLDADAYEQEGPLTTFFDRNGGGGLASAFALRVASFRTSRIVEIRRVAFGAPARLASCGLAYCGLRRRRWRCRALVDGRLSDSPDRRTRPARRVE
jgi:hypothetical protein